jgi:hypothetical protein
MLTKRIVGIYMSLISVQKKTRNITGYTRKRKVDKEKRKRQVFLSLDVAKCNNIFHFCWGKQNKQTKTEGITDIA